MKAKENYDVTEVLGEYEKKWSIFKSKLYEFKAMKNNRGCYESSNDLKDWSVQLFTTDKRKKVRYESYIPKLSYPEKVEYDNSSSDFETMTTKENGKLTIYECFFMF